MTLNKLRSYRDTPLYWQIQKVAEALMIAKLKCSNFVSHKYIWSCYKKIAETWRLKFWNLFIRCSIVHNNHDRSKFFSNEMMSYMTVFFSSKKSITITHVLVVNGQLFCVNDWNDIPNFLFKFFRRCRRLFEYIIF